jgi:hypothetical protein
VWTAGGKDISNDSLGSLGIDGHVTSRIVLKRQAAIVFHISFYSALYKDSTTCLGELFWGLGSL